ncbi:MAG: sarcosine oxidase subunit gamma family protein [Hyphomicrobiaceae bacterium]
MSDAKTDPRRRSALSHRDAVKAPNGAARLAELPFRGKIALRGAPDRISGAVGEALGLKLPVAVKGTSRSGGASALWLGPDEWMIVTEAGGEGAAKAALDKALAGSPAQTVDVTDYYTEIVLAGPKAREILMRIATVDLHPRAFKAGDCIVSNFGRTVSICTMVEDVTSGAEDRFEIIVRISMADYLWCTLAEAGHEWGLPELAPKAAKVKLHLPHFEHG